MPYSFLHIAALRNDIESATAYLEGGGQDKVHLWEGIDPRKALIDPIEVDERDDQVQWSLTYRHGTGKHRTI